MLISEFRVLILVVVEDGLVHANERTIPANMMTGVLILVVVEDGLVPPPIFFQGSFLKS